jgi:hypothetical protein
MGSHIVKFYNMNSVTFQFNIEFEFKDESKLDNLAKQLQTVLDSFSIEDRKFEIVFKHNEETK